MRQRLDGQQIGFKKKHGSQNFERPTLRHPDVYHLVHVHVE